MHVLLAGATSALVRPIVPLLLARGHRVTGLNRSVERPRGPGRRVLARPSSTSSRGRRRRLSCAPPHPMWRCTTSPT